MFKIGGAQAVAALAYGTETVPQVDKIVGPGRRLWWLPQAEVVRQVDIDMIAGPSEILVVADGKSDPAWWRGPVEPGGARRPRRRRAGDGRRPLRRPSKTRWSAS